MEIDSQVMVETNSGQQLVEEDCAEAEACVKEATKEMCNTETEPCEATNAGESVDDLEVSVSIQVMNNDLDNKEVKDTADIETKEVENCNERHSQVESHLEDVINELKPCSEGQVKDVGNCSELEPCANTEEVFVDEKVEPISRSPKNILGEGCCMNNLVEEAPNDAEAMQNDVIDDSKIEPCAENNAPEPMDIGGLEPLPIRIDVKEGTHDIRLESCPKNEVKEASNDDIYSEVSNPDLPQKLVSSGMTTSSQPLDVHGSDHGGCGEVTSACYRHSFADEEDHNKCELESVATSCVVLEIPKHVRPTGIRKITFKFRKRKEGDYDSNPPGAIKPQTQSDEMNSSMDHGSQSPISSKTIPDSYPANVKRLLSTGILEGAGVKYITISGEKEISGIIKGCGYLCGCCSCNFSKVVSAYEFELHAGSKTRHPNNHIYLENGKSIYSIIEELRTASPSNLDSVIRAVAGSSVNEEYLQVWKANLQYGNDGANVDSANQSKSFGMHDCSTSYPSHYSEDRISPASSLFSYITLSHQESYMKVPVERKRPMKKQRHSVSGSFWGQKKAAASGGNKKRDNDLHKILFMPNGLPDGTSLAYYSKGKRILGGYKQGNGIVCSCCNTEISPSQFEAHAGWAVKRQPYRHIYTSSGLTLHDIALMMANGQTLDSIGSDDMCAFCGDGGELKMCNGCPRAFHAACLDGQCTTTDDWLCPYCKDKSGPDGKASGKSRSIILRLKKDGKAPDFVAGGCIICRSQDFSAAKFDDRTVIICDQCEKEYHVGCLRATGMCDLKELPGDKWFCCAECHKIFEVLQNKSCSMPEAIPSSSLSVLYRKHAIMNLNGESNNDVAWCVINGKKRFVGHLRLLSRAAQIFRECFDPIVATSGRDLIPIMVYGRNISGQEFSGMYTVVLIVRSIVVSAALIRIFGQEIAEIPLVATDRDYQGKGYFRALFSSIEWLLSSLGVKHMVLPAAEEAEPMWVNKLGFTRMSHEQMLKYTRDYQLTMFKGTSLLEREVQTTAE